MRLLLCFSIVCLQTISASQAAVIYSINPGATPASPPGNTVDFVLPGNDIAWKITPNVTGTLTGISTNFGPFGGTQTTPTVTVEIQSDRPADGGVVLASGTFQVNSATGGIAGATFAPIPFTAGTTYFVDFKGINGLGVDLGTWQNVGGNPSPSGGATVNLGTDYSDTATSTGFTVVTGNGDYGVSTNGVNVSGAEPILFFTGTLSVSASTPEPSSFLLAAIALGSLVWIRRRKTA